MVMDLQDALEQLVGLDKWKLNSDGVPFISNEDVPYDIWEAAVLNNKGQYTNEESSVITLAGEAKNEFEEKIKSKLEAKFFSACVKMARIDKWFLDESGVPHILSSDVPYEMWADVTIRSGGIYATEASSVITLAGEAETELAGKIKSKLEARSLAACQALAEKTELFRLNNDVPAVSDSDVPWDLWEHLMKAGWMHAERNSGQITFAGEAKEKFEAQIRDKINGVDPLTNIIGVESTRANKFHAYSAAVSGVLGVIYDDKHELIESPDGAKLVEELNRLIKSNHARPDRQIGSFLEDVNKAMVDVGYDLDVPDFRKGEAISLDVVKDNISVLSAAIQAAHEKVVENIMSAERAR